MQAPNLHTMSFYGIVPAPIPGASVQELSLNLPAELGLDFMDFFVALKDLLAFLQETPSLQSPEAGNRYFLHRGDTVNSRFRL